MLSSGDIFSSSLFFFSLLFMHAIFSRELTVRNLIKSSANTLAMLASLCALIILASVIIFLDLFNLGIYRVLFITEISTLALPLTSMFLIIIAAIYYNVHFSREYLWQFVIYSFAIYLGGMLFVLSNAIIIMFIGYELILMPTVVVLENFSKTSKSREATTFMIVWTQLGAILLFFLLGYFFPASRVNGFLILTLPETRLLRNLLMICVFFGFAPKMPIWPFYWWLPEAHVEVPTSFSIVLSGVSIKFAFLGYVRFIEFVGDCDIYWVFIIIAVIGLIDAALKLDTETDIKKIVAYQTVIEMHAFVVFVSLDVDAFADFVMFALVAHCWVSTSGFIFVDIISRRLHTRNIEKLYGVVGSAPVLTQLLFLMVFIFCSVPGTLVFSIEFYIQILSTTSAYNFVVFAVVQLFIVIWSKNIWWLMWGGDKIRHEHILALTKNEYTFILLLVFQSLPTLLFTGSWY